MMRKKLNRDEKKDRDKTSSGDKKKDDQVGGGRPVLRDVSGEVTPRPSCAVLGYEAARRGGP